MYQGYRVIDADAHFYEPANIWEQYVEAEYQDRIPRVAQIHSRAILEYEDGKVAVGPDRTISTRMIKEKFGRAYDAWWSLESRIQDMDEQGWDVQVCLATNAAVSAAYDRDVMLYAAMCRAFNTWAADFCGGAPGRVKYAAMVPGRNLDAMVTESRRAVGKLGAVSVFLPQVLTDTPWHHPDYDQVWQTAVEMEFPFAIHGMDSASGFPLAGARYRSASGGAGAINGLTGFPFENMLAMAHFMLTGILDRFPTLRLLVLESNAGWLPWALHRLGEITGGRQATYFREHPLKASPKEYFLRQCAIAADADEPTLKYVVDYLGDENIVFNTDYPHFDAPPPPQPLQDLLAQPISDEAKTKILWDNSLRIYGPRLLETHA